VGFIGLGNMGKPMAANLLKAGHAVTVFDVARKPRDELMEQGAKVAAKAADVATGADAIVTMLPSSPHVKEVSPRERVRANGGGQMMQLGA
jgi:3-hydroxyisobutyrate dehydrogenase-like beta-hydroxyacid dehydrogenase